MIWMQNGAKITVPTPFLTWNGHGLGSMIAEFVSFATEMAIGAPTGAGEGPTVTPTWPREHVAINRPKRTGSFEVMTSLPERRGSQNSYTSASTGSEPKGFDCA